MRARSLVVLVMPLLLAAQGTEDNSKKDLEKLQGTWKPVSLESDGANPPDEVLKGWTLTVAKKEYTISIFMDLGGGMVSKSVTKLAFVLDPAKKPKAIDFVNPLNAKNKMLGIYELEGDTLKICTSKPGTERPNRFESKAGSGWSLEVYKRANPGK
jgi:uncharacterized protein (TIGR03067 family)